MTESEYQSVMYMYSNTVDSEISQSGKNVELI